MCYFFGVHAANLQSTLITWIGLQTLLNYFEVSRTWSINEFFARNPLLMWNKVNQILKEPYKEFTQITSYLDTIK